MNLSAVESLLAQRDAVLFGEWTQGDPIPGTACLGWRNGTDAECFVGSEAAEYICEVLAGGGHAFIIEYNDHPGRTREDVLGVLDEALRLAKSDTSHDSASEAANG